MNIGLFGGTFDPPHVGHLRAAQAAADALALDRLLVVPSGLPPHKALPRSSAPAEHRRNMARLMWREVLDWELDGRVHYSADTVERLRALYPDDTLWLLAGADMFLTLPSWFAPERIFRAARIGAFARAGGQDLRPYAETLREQFGARIDLIPLDAVEISSTEIRARLARGEDAGAYLTEEVGRYIAEHGLYAVP